jgi:hypothetical protein
MKLKQFLMLGAILGLTVVFSGCATQEIRPTLTPLEIQSLQTRVFEHQKSIVFAGTLSVFQDLGYTVTSADLMTGLITVEGATQDNPMLTFWTGGGQMRQTRATAFVEEIRGNTAVRLSFVEIDERSGGYGGRTRRDTPILDAQVYQNAFERIENAIFVRTSY